MEKTNVGIGFIIITMAEMEKESIVKNQTNKPTRTRNTIFLFILKTIPSYMELKGRDIYSCSGVKKKGDLK